LNWFSDIEIFSNSFSIKRISFVLIVLGAFELFKSLDFVIKTPAFQTSVFAFFIHVNFLPLWVWVMPTFVQAFPGLGGDTANAGTEVITTQREVINAKIRAEDFIVKY
jgi:hypothetical protein